MKRRRSLTISLTLAVGLLAMGVVIGPAATPADAAPYGYALSLDGADDFATAPDSTSLDIGDLDGESFTVEAFVYVDNATKTEGENDIVWHKGTSTMRGSVVFRSGSEDTLVFYTNVGSLTRNLNLNDGWHHMAWVFDNQPGGSPDRLSIFLDGGEVAYTTAVALSGFPNTSSAFQVGGYVGVGGWDDWIDEVRVSGSVRYGPGGYTVPAMPFATDASTRALWHFDEDAGAAVFADSSENGNTLTGVNGAHTGWFGSADPAAVSFAAASKLVAESAGTVQLGVTRTGNTGVAASASYSRVGGTATAGVDYTFTAGTVSFAPGDVSEGIPVTILNDDSEEASETIVLSLSSPGEGTLLGAPTTITLTIRASDQQPDGWISTAAASGFIGNDVYNTTGAGQTKTLKAQRTKTRTFYTRVYNDGNVKATFALKGSPPLIASTVRYYSGVRDVTSAMRSVTGLKLSIGPGAYKAVKVVIKVLSGAVIGSRKTATVTGSWSGDGVNRDVVKGVVTVVR